MRMNLYCFKDMVSGDLSPVFACRNDDVVRRAFWNLVRKEEANEKDLEIMYMGHYDDVEGQIEVDDVKFGYVCKFDPLGNAYDAEGGV